jgi:hypothetical protein
MAISTGQISVTTTRAQIDGTGQNPFKLILHNSGTNSIFLGNETVTKDDGFNLHTNSTLILELPPLSSIYAVTSSGTHDLSWMRIA